VRNSLSDSTSLSLEILEYTSFSSSKFVLGSESEAGSTSEASVATNPTTTSFSSHQTLLDLNLLDLKVGFLDFSLDFSFCRSGQSAMKCPCFLQLKQPF